MFEWLRRKTVRVGDRIQWELDGILRFESPKKVTDIQNDPKHGTYVFVEGSHTGIPMKQVRRVN